MWNYQNISREEFERIKDHIEEIMVAHGAVVFDIVLPYTQKTTSIIENGNDIAFESRRKVYLYNGLYYRIDEVCFADNPYIVAEVGTYDDLMKNTMEDAEPFPFYLSEADMNDEVSYFLGQKPYPD